MNLSIISPRDHPAIRSVFELGLPEEMDKEGGEHEMDHAISPGHLVLFQGFEVPGQEKKGVATFVNGCGLVVLATGSHIYLFVYLLVYMFVC